MPTIVPPAARQVSQSGALPLALLWRVLREIAEVFAEARRMREEAKRRYPHLNFDE